MYYLIDLNRRRVIVWRDSLTEIKEFMRTHDIGESEHLKIVKDFKLI